jgi:hypothetical protein
VVVFCGFGSGHEYAYVDWDISHENRR